MSDDPAAESRAADHSHPRPLKERSERRRELAATILLSIATVLTAWSVFQATKWHGEMSIAHSDANAARAQYSVASEDADAVYGLDMELFTEWVDAHSRGDAELATAYATHFREGFKPAFDAWLAMNPSGSFSGPKTPFDMDEYSIPERQQASDLLAKSEQLSEDARDDVSNSDSYTLTTVLLASVLFFAGISVKLDSGRISWAILIMGALILLGAGLSMSQLPIAG